MQKYKKRREKREFKRNSKPLKMCWLFSFEEFLNNLWLVISAIEIIILFICTMAKKQIGHIKKF